MLCRSKTATTFLFGARKLFLCIIVVNRVPEYVVHKLSDIRGGSKVKFMIREVSMGRFSQTVRYPNSKQKGVHQHIAGSTFSVNYGVCDLLIDLDAPLRGVMLWVMRLISSGVGVVLLHDL